MSSEQPPAKTIAQLGQEFYSAAVELRNACENLHSKKDRGVDLKGKYGLTDEAIEQGLRKALKPEIKKAAEALAAIKAEAKKADPSIE